ncbi:MAG: hypothetical protein JXK04_03810 [Campylobacterales bacterium]|nr:hypothetical protein [Campylobacterales bacterium]
MENSVRDNYGSVLILDTAKERAREYQQGKRRERRRIEEGFFDQPVDYRAYVLSPEGYEGAMTAFYIALIPYLAGLAFLFSFIARGQFEHFITFDLTSFFIIWAIGYEVCAAMILGAIFAGWLKYLANRWNEE